MDNKRKIIGAITLAIMCIIFLIIGYKTTPHKKEVNSEEYEDLFVESKVTESEFKNTSIMVDIRGAVKKPGVYSLDQDSRVVDLVNKAGGFLEDADLNRVHLSKKLSDEELIYVYKKGEENRNDIVQLDKSTDSNSLNKSQSNGKVNLNNSSLEELKTLPGIGDITAKKIIEYREKNGGFKSIEELKKVDRIGEKTFNKLSDKVDI